MILKRAHSSETPEVKIWRMRSAQQDQRRWPAWKQELFTWALAIESGRDPLIAIGGEAVLPDHPVLETASWTSQTTRGSTADPPTVFPPKDRHRRRHPETGPRIRAHNLPDAPTGTEVRDKRRPTAEDVRVMQGRYPSFNLAPHHPRTGLPFWVGQVWPFRPCLDGIFQVEVRYVGPDNPRAFVVSPRIDRSVFRAHPHLHRDGAVCSYFPGDGTWEWGTHDVSVLVDITSGWLVQHLCWYHFGFWPGREFMH